MKSHEGAVKVESQPGQGTVFQLFFPVYLRQIAQIRENLPILLITGNPSALSRD